VITRRQLWIRFSVARPRIPSVRISPDNETVLKNLGLLADLAGNWHGKGFNLVARPDFEDQTNVFLELNLTSETTKFDPISSSIPNRGFGQPDIELFGLTYLQKISDATTGGALHIEPGIWITQPATSDPPLSPPAGGQLVSRMANIPHGNSMLAQGVATSFNGPPTISPGDDPISGVNPAFSLFPSFNTTAIDLQPPLLPARPSAPLFSPAGLQKHNQNQVEASRNTPLPMLPAQPTRELRWGTCLRFWRRTSLRRYSTIRSHCCNKPSRIRSLKAIHSAEWRSTSRQRRRSHSSRLP
jgi:hypothetical protein